MSVALLTPVDRVKGSVPDSGTRRFRKQIIPKTSITYEGQRVDFNEEYLADLVKAFKSGAKNQVTFQLADSKNTHTNDPERTRGHIVDLELTADGLDGIIELDERGVEVIKHNPNLGVSARIVSNVERANDGRTFQRALQHVLGTVDPKVIGMRPWEQVSLSNEDGVTETTDLSAVDYPGAKEEKMTTTKAKVTEPVKPEDEKVTLTLSKEDHEVFLQLIEDQKVAAQLSNPDGEEDEPGDGDEGDEEPGGEGPPLALSNEHVQAIELARATAETAQTQALELANQLRRAEVDREVDQLRNTGLAPAIIDLARPVLELPVQAIELANGTKVDPGKAMREVLHQVIELARSGHDMIDLDVEAGVLVGTDSVQEQRSAALSAWNAEYGN